MLCGWLSPNGEFYPCSSYGHVSLAEKLVEERYKAQKMEDQLRIPKDDLLLSDKWIKLFQDGLVAGNFSLPRPAVDYRRTSYVDQWQNP